MGNLQGKIAVITGATSGIGFATAKIFVEAGAYVFITGRNQNKLDEAVASIGRNVSGIQGDAADLADLDRLFATVQKEKGGLDILFLSAGHGSQGKLGEVSEAHFDAIFDLNVRGTWFTAQKALPLLRDGGAIVINGSIASVKGFGGRGVSSASKAAVRSFARTWLVELKERNIRVNVVSPGPIDTESRRVLAPEIMEQVRATVPSRKLGRPEEIAAAVLFLASDDASFVNGVELFVDGGSTQI